MSCLVFSRCGLRRPRNSVSCLTTSAQYAPKTMATTPAKTARAIQITERLLLDHVLVLEQLHGQLDARGRHSLACLRPNTGCAEPTRDLALGIHPGTLKHEDVLH